jgi:hypothetical protein
MLKITLITTTYPAPEDHEEDYCPDGTADVEELAVGFRELVGLLRDYGMPSCSHPTGDQREWVSREGEQDYATGEWSEQSLHYAHDNPPRMLKHWSRAWRAAGLVK